jgi:hypothetical protein
LDRVKLWLSFIKKDWKWAEYEFVVGSHNVEKGSESQGFYDTNVWYDVEKSYNIKQKMWKYVKCIQRPDNMESGITIYGEIYGAGIQKGYDYGEKDIKFIMFDATMRGDYIGTTSSWYLAEHVLGLPYAKILYEGKWSKEVQDHFVFNNFIEGTKIPHEGVVVKHISGDRRKVSKVINPDYLIYAEKHNVEDSH